eukprot:CAMPEP_0179484560 /NCGR_PEP_ID=MMETSP0799-20121207/61422_1 /TAXON_ID=46947 /ORGANISM="Geminigera cryophila, Strain CCMP2564" /LENGTH=286 /DNA_ID=CAMNT_0021298557 /DNA_START=65 /DNA_END=922 /DNA_ORIENTATION=-
MDSRLPILSAVSGMGAGAAMVAVSHPLSAMVAVSREGVWATVKRTASLTGLRALYKGAPLASGALVWALLGANDVIRRTMQSGHDLPMTSFEIGQVGTAAGALAGLLEQRRLGFVSRFAISTGVFFGVSNLVRTRCFAEDQSLQAVVVGGAVGGIVSISTGVFFGVSNLVRTRCFAEDQSLQAVVVGGAVGGIVSISTGVFFGVSNLVRTRCFAEDQSLQAVVVGGAVGGIVSETTRLSLENVSAYAKAVKLVGPSAGFHSIVKSMGTQVARSLPGTVSFVITASA